MNSVSNNTDDHAQHGREEWPEQGACQGQTSGDEIDAHSNNGEDNPAADKYKNVANREITKANTRNRRRSRRASARASQILIGGDLHNTDDKRLIRKKQNRDSARRCRLKRKMQTADIFQMLKEQRDMIVNLSSRVEELGGILHSPQRRYLGKNLAGTSCDEDQKLLGFGQDGKNEKLVGFSSGITDSDAMLAATVPIDVSTSPVSGATTSRGENNTVDETPSTTQSAVHDPQLVPQENVDTEALRARINSKSENIPVSESVLQFDGMHLPDLGFLDSLDDD